MFGCGYAALCYAPHTEDAILAGGYAGHPTVGIVNADFEHRASDRRTASRFGYSSPYGTDFDYLRIFIHYVLGWGWRRNATSSFPL
jgi:hypothetical protein